MIGTIILSNVVNNAAAAVLMAPIAISLTHGMGVSIDPFLAAHSPRAMTFSLFHRDNPADRVLFPQRYPNATYRYHA